MWNWEDDGGNGPFDSQIGTQGLEPQDENSQRPWVQPTLMKSSIPSLSLSDYFAGLIISIKDTGQI